jgi:hypothetical protein
METSSGVTAKQYTGRRNDCIVLNTTIDMEAVELLRQYCPQGRRATGKFLARLLYEHDARQKERQRMQQVVQSALEESAIVR